MELMFSKGRFKILSFTWHCFTMNESKNCTVFHNENIYSLSETVIIIVAFPGKLGKEKCRMY